MELGIRPALLRMTSTRPCFSTARSTSALTSSTFVTSVRRTASSPSESSVASAWRRSTRRAPRTSLAPSRARRRAVASPSPLLAPVMTTILPSIPCAIVLLPFVLLVGDGLHPVHDPPILMLVDGDVRHGGGRRSAVPMLLARLEPDDVARPDLLDRTTLALHETEAGGDDQRLAERVRVPGGA